MTTDEENREWKLFHDMNGITEADRRAARDTEEIRRRTSERGDDARRPEPRRPTR